jgi:GAF domain-containing protein
MSFEYINLKRDKLITNAKAIIDHNIPMVSNLANLSSLIKESFPNTSWAGFYLYDEEKEQLFLGPFQGGMACTIIPLGKGVCGNAAKTLKTQLVPDVNLYPSHIACSSLTKSEVVVPIIDDDKILGVIDLDSEEYANYKVEDVRLLEELASIISLILK